MNEVMRMVPSAWSMDSGYHVNGLISKSNQRLSSDKVGISHLIS